MAPRTARVGAVVGALCAALASCSAAAHSSATPATSPTSPITATSAAVTAGQPSSAAIDPSTTAPAPTTAPVATTASPDDTPVPQPPPALVAIRASDNAVVSLDPGSGSVRSTLAVSARPTDKFGFVTKPSIALDRRHELAYYDIPIASACPPAAQGTIWRVPVSGGTPEKVATGLEPAVSADASLLAYVVDTCLPNAEYTTEIHVRDLASGTERVLPDPVPATAGLPPFPVLQLSFSPDAAKLAVSVNAVQDAEGMAVYVEDIASKTSTAVPVVPISDGQRAQDLFLLPGAFLPDGTLFVQQACCTGFGPDRPNPTSVLATVEPTTGRLDREIAHGFPDRDHRSLAADATGSWLLYVSGTDLDVSRGGARPTVLAKGITAASW